MRSRLLIAALSLFALLAHAQQYPSPDSQDQSTQADCSDPSMASSPQCSRPGAAFNPGSLQIPGSAAETLSAQPGRVTTYSDLTGRNQVNPQQGLTTPLRPELLTEFQKFIISTTGEVLPIYGASLFQNVPSTFAPLENSPVPSDYILGPGDELRIRVWGQVNFNANLRIDRSGDIFLPEIGAVHVAGLNMDDAQHQVHDAISRVYRNFQLLLEMGQIRSIQVYVTGEARRPGVYTVSSLSTLVDALFASGGPSAQGSMRHIELRRGPRTVTTLDLYALLVKGDKSNDAKLLSGDVIFIPAVGPQVAVTGSVRRPGIYELLPGETFANALRDAGGPTAGSAARASIDRAADHNGRLTVEVKLDSSGLATPLDDGDVLHVFSQVAQYHKTVTLRGNTANPGRFAWHQGMHLSDLIPDRDSLLTREYWWKRAQLGLPALEFQPLTGLSSLRQPSAPINLRRPPPTPTAPQPSANGQPEHQNTPYASSEDAYAAPSDAAALADAFVHQDQAHNPDNSAPQQPYPAAPGSAPRTGSQSALAVQGQADSAPLTPPPSPRTEVRLAVPDIDWSYAVIERIDPVTLKTQLLPFDLGRLVNDHDPSQDLALQPGDVVSIFSQSDIHVPVAEQTTLVRLEGEFAHAGTYSALPGETLRQLVERAGGLTPNAYLYGSVFTRESTRILQQRRIDESIRQMTLEMQRGNLALAANPVAQSSDLASMNAAQASEQALIAQLQQIRASGRVVFQFEPDSTGLQNIPDIKLENGDTFLVPALPSTVNVLGAVFNQNSFVYRRGARVGTLLDLAGGPNSDADRKRMFVIRANGAVVSRTVAHGFWDDEFFRLHLYPGDTVIVPEKTIKPSALRGVLDWTQIFSQLAFGAAAINVLR